MYAFIFEDKDITPSSKLLKSSYNGSNIFFSDKNVLMRFKVNELLDKGYTKIVVFLDVNPNNSNTVSLLGSLASIKSKDERWKDVIIVPIICIEFYIAKICKEFGYFDEKQLERPIVKYLVCDFDWDNIPDLFKSKSLEKIYKRLFESGGSCQSCLDNRVGQGKFFLEDCDCKDCNSCNTQLSKKAEQLYTCLPVFDVIDMEHENLLKSYNINYEQITLDVLHQKQQEFYNKICTKLGKKHILISTIKGS